MDKITTDLIDSLEAMMEWARQVRDETIDGPDMRGVYREDMNAARQSIAAARAANGSCR